MSGDARDAYDAYADIAIWYDVEHDGVTEDLECYQELLSAQLAPRSSLLEIGSGTGRIAAALAASGYGVTGIEPSLAMRDRCAKRLASLPERVSRRVRVVAGTVAEPGLAANDEFDAALFGLNTFAHLTSLAERQQALATLASHLRPSGIVILDLDLAGPRRLAETAGQMWWQGTWPISESSESLSHFVVGEHGATSGTVRVAHFYDLHAQAGTVRRTTTTMELAVLTYGEVALGLLHGGFALADVYGSYDLAPFEDGSPRLLVLARKAA